LNNVYMTQVLEALVKSLGQAKLPQVEMPTLPEHDLKVDKTGDKITQYVGTPTSSIPGQEPC